MCQINSVTLFVQSVIRTAQARQACVSEIYIATCDYSWLPDALQEEPARETQVPGLLGHVDLHDPLEQRVERLLVLQRHVLHVIDRVLTAEHEEEK